MPRPQAIGLGDPSTHAFGSRCLQRATKDVSPRNTRVCTPHRVELGDVENPRCVRPTLHPGCLFSSLMSKGAHGLFCLTREEEGGGESIECRSMQATCADLVSSHLRVSGTFLTLSPHNCPVCYYCPLGVRGIRSQHEPRSLPALQTMPGLELGVRNGVLSRCQKEG